MLFALLAQGVGPALSQASQLIPGEQCFSATTATSGGSTGVITSLGTLSGGSGYVAGSGAYSNVPLTGGSGQGALATITVSAGAVNLVILTNPGFHYALGDVLSANNANLGGSGSGFSIPVATIATTGTGMVGALATITPGTGGTTGVYGGIPLTGGAGSGATANITVSGGGVTAVAILNPGVGYQVGDILSANSGSIGNVSGFSVPIGTVAINSSLAGGTVSYYIPNTQTFKQTWQNATQTSLNTNPVQLDANGCAIVYGTGTYRQILKDSLGNTVWDQLTTALAIGNNSFWAGQAGGTANAITVTDAGFAGVDGSIINFLPLLSNTGATTLNPSSFGNIPVVKDTASGPVALTGGEIVVSGQPNIVSVQFSATQFNFHLLNTVIGAPVATQPPLCGASGLTIVNNTGSPSAVVTVTARQLVLQNAGGFTVNRANTSFTINTTLGNMTSAAGGMDGEAPGISAWIDLFGIDNGTAAAGLGSLAAGNGQTPVLPTNYTYKCYLGAVRVDSSGNLLHTIQHGVRTQYVVTAASNTAALPVIDSGSKGTVTTPSTWIAEPISSFVPPTAGVIELNLQIQNGTNGAALAAPNNAYGSIASTTNPPPCSENGGGVTALTLSMSCSFVIEPANTVYYSSSTASAALAAEGWIDAVNAN